MKDWLGPLGKCGGIHPQRKTLNTGLKHQTAPTVMFQVLFQERTSQFVAAIVCFSACVCVCVCVRVCVRVCVCVRSEEHTSELQSHLNLVCRLLLEKKQIQMTTSVST